MFRPSLITDQPNTIEKLVAGNIELTKTVELLKSACEELKALNGHGDPIRQRIRRGFAVAGGRLGDRR